MFKFLLKKHKMKVLTIFIALISMGLICGYIVSYSFKPRVFSTDWFASRYHGWEAEQHALWSAQIVDVLGPKTIKVKNRYGKESIMDLLYLNTLYSSEKTNKFYLDHLSQYIGQELLIKGNPDKNRFHGALIDGNGENINLNLFLSTSRIIKNY